MQSIRKIGGKYSQNIFGYNIEKIGLDFIRLMFIKMPSNSSKSLPKWVGGCSQGLPESTEG